MTKDSLYDWIVIGGGISSIAISEILSREGKAVLLLEKNEKLASETSKVFHEWFHSGALYTLIPDNLLTLRYLLGATDDLIEYYSCFSRMNLIPSESGIEISKNGWFNKDRIEYMKKYANQMPYEVGFFRNTWVIENMKAALKEKYDGLMAFLQVNDAISFKDNILYLEA